MSPSRHDNGTKNYIFPRRISFVQFVGSLNPGFISLRMFILGELSERAHLRYDMNS